MTPDNCEAGYYDELNPIAILSASNINIDLYFNPATADNNSNGWRCKEYVFEQDFDEVWVVGCDSTIFIRNPAEEHGYLFTYQINSDAQVKFDGRGTSQNAVIFSNIKAGDTFYYYTYRDDSGLLYLNGMKYIGINITE